MTNARIEALAQDLYNHVFRVLDAEPEMPGMDCGYVATAVQAAFSNAMEDEPDDAECDLIMLGGD